MSDSQSSYGTIATTRHECTKAGNSCSPYIKGTRIFGSVILALLFVLLVVYLHMNFSSNNVPPLFALEREIPSDGIQVTNCAQISDQSCDEQHGCVYYRTGMYM